jgi:hypothetical protein
METKQPETIEDGNWDAPVEDDDKVRKESDLKDSKENEVENKPKIEEPKIVYQKDKYGNILITSLGEYVEPPKKLKGLAANEVKSEYNVFSTANVEISDDDEEEITKVITEEEIYVADSKAGKAKDKKKATKQKHAVAGDLDDILKEFGVENKIKEEPKETKKKDKVEKIPKEKPKDEKVDAENPVGEKKEEGDDKKKKKPAEKKSAPTKTHLNDARREIKEKQDALKKKQKKKGI